MRSHDVHVTCEGCVHTYHPLLPHLTLQHDEVKDDKAEGMYVCIPSMLDIRRGGEEGRGEEREGRKGEEEEQEEGDGGRGGKEGMREGGEERRKRGGIEGVHYLLLISVCE